MILRDRSGVALLLTLFVVTFMTAVTVQLIVSVNRHLMASYNQSDGVRLDCMIESGLALGRAALYADHQENDFDSPHDEWAKLDSAVLSALFGDSRLEVRVVDLSGRLPVNGLVAEKKKGAAAGGDDESATGQNAGTNDNKDKDNADADADTDTSKAGNNSISDDQAAAYREVWKRFLTSGRFAIESETRAEELLDALADWIDSDDEERDNGAEKSHYLSQTPSYACANAPFVHPGELLLVKGMSRELLYGNGEHEGIINYITVAGEGAININSAPVPVLQALGEDISEEMAEELISFREDEENIESLADAGWYKKIIEADLNSKVIGLSSDYFQISVEAVYNGLGKTGTGVIQRHATKEQTLLYWKVE